MGFTPLTRSKISLAQHSGERRRLRRMDEDDDARRTGLDLVDHEAGRQQGVWVQKVHRCRFSGWGIPYERPASTQSATEPFFHADPGSRFQSD